MAVDAIFTVGRGLGLLCLGILFLVATAATLRSARLVAVLSSAPVVPAADLCGRFGSVQGQLETDHPLSAPVSGEPCIAYVLEETAVETGPTGTLSTEDSTEVAVVTPFRVVDATGWIPVEPAGEAAPWAGGDAHTVPVDALADAPVEKSRLTADSEEPLPEPLADAVATLQRFGSRHADRFEYRERRVPVGETATVTGRHADGTLLAGDPFRIATGSPQGAAWREAAVTVVLLSVALVVGVLLAAGLWVWVL